MKKGYEFVGVNDGCIIASNVIGKNADELESALSKLKQDSIDGGFDLSKRMSHIFTKNDVALYSGNFSAINGDKYIIDTLAPFVYWKGQYAKIDGCWACTTRLFKALCLIFYDREVSSTKQSKDYNDLINSVGATTKGLWITYSEMVEQLSAQGSVNISSARNLLTKLVREGLIDKNKTHNSYKVAQYLTKNNLTKQIEQDNSLVVETTPAVAKVSYKPIGDDLDEYGGNIDLDDRKYDFGKKFIIDYGNHESVGDTWYDVDMWINKRLASNKDYDAKYWLDVLAICRMDDLCELSLSNWKIKFIKK